MSRKNIDAHIKKIFNENEKEVITVEPKIIEEYRELSDKCDVVITKIKKRKNSKIKETSNV